MFCINEATNRRCSNECIALTKKVCLSDAYFDILFSTTLRGRVLCKRTLPISCFIYTKNDVIYGDIKAENSLVTPDLTLKF
jgi:hypothetical protein